MSVRCQTRKSTLFVRRSLTAAIEVYCRESVWRYLALEEDVPDRDACIAKVPIAIEFQVYDPLFVAKDVRGHRLTIDDVFSGPTLVGDVR
jgi:hypothetical protein